MKHSISNDLKQYISISRSCRISDTCEVDAKLGAIEFDFHKLGDNLERCVLHARRKSGNGQVIIASKNVLSKAILSTVVEYIDIELAKEHITIKRPRTSIGAIEILGFDIYTGEDLYMGNAAWKSILAKCTFKNIRLVESKLFAAEGGTLQADTIGSIITNPPNMCVIKDHIAKFLGPCEIIHIDLDGQLRAGISFPHLDMPVQLKQPEISQHTGYKTSHIITPTVRRDFMPPDSILYDSDVYNGFTTVETFGSTKIEGQLARIGHRGGFNIPISTILPNATYVLAITAQIVNGNGKLCVNIQPSTDRPYQFVVNTQSKTYNITLKTNTDYPFNIEIVRPASATGDVKINRIILLRCGHHQPHVIIAKIPKLIEQDYHTFEIEPSFSIIENDIEKSVGVYKMDEVKELKFVFVIPSYNNVKWVEQNLNSVFNQTNKNFRVIFTDDCSTDGTYEKAKAIVESREEQARTELIRNDKRKGALCNLYNSIHSCDDKEIIITLDGDDWMANDTVIDKLSEVYSNSNVWLTYGQYESHPDKGKGCSQQIPRHITEHNAFRQFRWCTSHLRTFYSFLFKKIKKEDLLDNSGNFYPMAWDLGFQFPMLEMGGPHCIFIPDVLYIYNVANPINDSKVNLRLQQSLEKEIRAKPKYDRL